jgi:cytosine/adenosine deaminase-related metal-dependent hydrolase
LTGSRDLLGELRVARQTGYASDRELLDMVTVNAARMLRLSDAGRLAPGVPADLIVVPGSSGSAASALLAAERRDVSLVVVDGRPLVGDTPFSAAFAARGVRARRLCVDGREKVADSGLVRRVAASPIREEGVGAAHH